MEIKCVFNGKIIEVFQYVLLYIIIVTLLKLFQTLEPVVELKLTLTI